MVVLGILGHTDIIHLMLMPVRNTHDGFTFSNITFSSNGYKKKQPDSFTHLHVLKQPEPNKHLSLIHTLVVM